MICVYFLGTPIRRITANPVYINFMETVNFAKLYALYWAVNRCSVGQKGLWS